MVELLQVIREGKKSVKVARAIGAACNTRSRRTQVQYIGKRLVPRPHRFIPEPQQAEEEREEELLTHLPPVRGRQRSPAAALMEASNARPSDHCSSTVPLACPADPACSRRMPATPAPTPRYACFHPPALSTAPPLGTPPTKKSRP